VQALAGLLSGRVFVVTGRTPVPEREVARRGFNGSSCGDTVAMVVSRCASEGMDLQGVDRVVVVSSTWNRATRQQVVGRAVRVGSHHPLPATVECVRVRLAGDDLSDGRMEDRSECKASDLEPVLRALREAGRRGS